MLERERERNRRKKKPTKWKEEINHFRNKFQSYQRDSTPFSSNRMIKKKEKTFVPIFFFNIKQSLRNCI